MWFAGVSWNEKEFALGQLYSLVPLATISVTTVMHR